MNSISNYFHKNTSAAPLAVFRILFGLMMLLSIIRFWLKGWIQQLYLEPDFHFSYDGFEWVKPLGDYTYVLFFLCGLAAFMIMMGFKYRFFMLLFFLSFTYIELMDKTTYLNHYYFISVLSFLLLFLPANAYFSIDAIIRKNSYQRIPKWTIDAIKLMVAIVYIYAGLAKINSDWLLNAMPLKIWITGRYNYPIVGDLLMQEPWFHYAMSWGGMLYDLSIPFLLLFKRTRLLGFMLVLFFHLFTKILFPIGMFPYIMIVSSLIFFDAKWHQQLIEQLSSLFNYLKISGKKITSSPTALKLKFQKVTLFIVAIFFTFQLLFPFRYLLYPGELFWTEEGYRFSWRVMLMEKKGMTTYTVFNQNDKTSFVVNNSNFLSSFQEKQMSFQADFILEFAHFLGDHYQYLAPNQIEVYAESYVALNGRTSKLMIDPTVDLYQVEQSVKPSTFILPFDDEIKGF